MRSIAHAHASASLRLKRLRKFQRSHFQLLFAICYIIYLQKISHFAAHLPPFRSSYSAALLRAFAPIYLFASPQPSRHFSSSPHGASVVALSLSRAIGLSSYLMAIIPYALSVTRLPAVLDEQPLAHIFADHLSRARADILLTTPLAQISHACRPM